MRHWDGHAAEKCNGVSSATAEERKRVYRERYLGPVDHALRGAQGEVPSLTCSQGFPCPV
jgi:hypothetical protein